MFYRFITTFILGLFYFSHPIFGAEPQFEVDLSSDTIRLDETALLKITIEWPKEEAPYAFAFPDLPLKNLEMTRRGESQESFFRNNREWTRKTFTLEFKGRETGEGRIETWTLPYIDPARQKAGRFTISEQRIRIKGRPFPFRGIPPILFTSLLVLFLSIVSGFLYIRKKRTPPGRAPVQEVSPYAGVIERFKTMGRESKPTRDKLYELSNEFRRFLTDYFHLQNQALSEEQILELLNQRDLSREESAQLRSLLLKLHEAKFAGLSLSSSEFDRLQTDILHYVEGKQVLGKL